MVSNDSSEWVVLAIALLLLVLAMRWVFGKPRTVRRRPPVDAAISPDLGLLRVVRADVDRSDVQALAATLAAAGVRASVSRRRDGRFDLVVFAADLDRARILLGP